MSYALLNNHGAVLEIVERRDNFVNSLPIVACDEAVRAGWLYNKDADTFMPPPPLPLEEQQAAMQADFTQAIQARLDAFAQTRGYDGIMSACSYFGSANPRFKAEADAAIRLRDETWAACYAILEAVLAGDRPAPTLEALFAELPPLEW